MSATRLNSWFWVLIVSLAATAAALAGRSNWGVTQLHAGTQLRGQSRADLSDQPEPADLAMAFETAAASDRGASHEIWRDAVADPAPAAPAKR